MNASILNRDFTHPTDGWYMIEPKGEHPKPSRGIIQVIDDPAAESIVNRFNDDADAGALSHGSEMLIDHEHFKHDLEKETIAYGWLNRLQNRADGIYGRIRWTTTGQKAVDGGDYRFFSSEYDPADLKILNTAGKLKRVRPTRLDGLTLTNSPSNKGGRPITNREGTIITAQFSSREDLRRWMQSPEGQQILHSTAVKNREFRPGPGGSAADTENNKTQNQKMKTVAIQLGLSADAAEEVVLAAVNKLMNRATEAEGKVVPLETRVKDLEASHQVLLGEQIAADLEARGIKDEKVINRLKPVLVTLKNRQERTEFLDDLSLGGSEETEAVATRAQAKGKDTTVLNRNDGTLPGKKTVSGRAASGAGANEQEQARKAEAEVQSYRIMNRCSYEDARNLVRTQKPELFGIGG
jgi:phage I-like protein